MGIRILLVEDTTADAELVGLALRKTGLEFTIRQVLNRRDFERALDEFDPDLIVSDHHLPQFSGGVALELAGALAPDVPFILVTGSLDEETAVDYMKAGATDYILKDRLTRLGPAVLGALERKRVERQARDREAYFQHLIEQAMDIIAVVDEDGAVRYASPSVLPLLGHAADDLVGRNLLDLVHGDDREATLRMIREGTTTGKGSRPLELRVRRPDGTYCTLEAIARHLLDDPTVRGVVINARDVTERRSLERQLLQAQKMEAVGRLAGGVAHDFNNMLTAILGYTGLLLEGLPTLSPLRPDIEEIEKAAQRAAGLTRQLLAFSRKQPQEVRVLDLNEQVADMHKLLGRLLGEDIEVVTKVAKALGPVRADASQLEQVIVNLAVNARDAMPEGGRLTIETANVELDDSYVREHVPVQPGPYVMLAVSDTGTGMSAETLSHVFEPFFTTKEPGKGTGLGLATVYGIVKQSGGYVWCYSEPGQGTTFKVYLPRVDAPLDRLPARDAARATRGSETVLLVEDETALRTLVRRILEKHGYKVLEASTADAASGLARDHAGPIHLLLTDVVLPGAGGRQLADELLVLRTELRVLFMSGYTEEVIAHRGMITANTAFIHKPFTSEGLVVKVRTVLDTRRP
ncbi:MAG TPA: response regulator [Gemmatimonadales bacterium]|jgi:two-component system cell cycle sensor histidine kinase/response regulator CckA|nr:response regulator [Gemmatimonadales bacterium]